MKKQRISFIYQAGDRTEFLNMIKRLKPTTVGVINDADFLKRILQEVPEIEVGWIRFYHVSDGEFWQIADLGNGLDPKDWLLQRWQAAGFTDSRAHLYVSNEPSPGNPSNPKYIENAQKLIHWHKDAMNFFRVRGIPTVILNSTAAFEPYLIDMGLFDDFLRMLADGFHKLGMHEYGGVIPFIGAGGKLKEDMLHKHLCQPDKWPSVWDVQIDGVNKKNNWLIGRLYLFDVRSDQLRIARAIKIVTEGGIDRHDVYTQITRTLETRYARDEIVNGKVKRLNVPYPHWTLRGINSARYVWEDYFLGSTLLNGEVIKDFSEAVYAYLIWLLDIYDDTIVISDGKGNTWSRKQPNQTRPSILGVNLFIWSPEQPEWDIQNGFSWHRLPKVIQLLISLTNSYGNEVPPVEPEPEPPKPPVKPRKGRHKDLDGDGDIDVPQDEYDAIAAHIEALDSILEPTES